MLQKFHEAVLEKADWIDERENGGDAEVDIKWAEPEQARLCEGVSVNWHGKCGYRIGPSANAQLHDQQDVHMSLANWSQKPCGVLQVGDDGIQSLLNESNDMPGSTIVKVKKQKPACESRPSFHILGILHLTILARAEYLDRILEKVEKAATLNE